MFLPIFAHLIKLNSLAVYHVIGALRFITVSLQTSRSPTISPLILVEEWHDLILGADHLLHSCQ